MSATSTQETPFREITTRCRDVQRSWSALTLRQRLEPVRVFRALLMREHDQLCRVVAQELRKNADEVLGGEILPVADACRFLLRQAARILRPRRVSIRQRPIWLWGQSDTVRRMPRGLIGLIGTWNFPILLNAVPLLQALTAGNAVVWKPSEVAPESAKAIFDLIQRSGYPAELVEMLPATREAGQQLALADIDHVQFTGSSLTGSKLAANLGERLISSTLELSGCDAMFVLDDADIALTARAAWFGMTVNAGQTCLAVRRVFVQRPVYSALVEALRKYSASAAPVRLALPSQAVQGELLVKEALAAGASLLYEPPALRPSADQFHPVVLLDARPAMAFCRDACFVPLMGLIPFDSPTDAVRMNGQCAYGLGASIFSADRHRAEQLAGEVRAGMVAINDVIMPTTHPATPFGGLGRSGWGVTQGEEGLLEMTIPQVLSARRGSFRPHYDLTERMQQRALMLRGLLELGHGLTLRQRIGGLWKLLRSFREPEAQARA